MFVLHSPSKQLRRQQSKARRPFVSSFLFHFVSKTRQSSLLQDTISRTIPPIFKHPSAQLPKFPSFQLVECCRKHGGEVTGLPWRRQRRPSVQETGNAMARMDISGTSAL